jgi:REP element-mobilizing transposase RayT
MPQYIRAFVPGGTFFFTVTLLERCRRLLTENLDNLREVQRGSYDLEWGADNNVRGLEME